MNRKVIVGYVDGEHAEDGLALARVLAAAGSVEEVVVAEALEDGDDAPARERAAEERIAAAADRAWPSQVRVAVRAKAGDSAPGTLARLTEDEGADLIVLGSTHRGIAGRVLAGTTADAILRETRCPVAIAPAGFADSRKPIRRIGVALDASEESRTALDWAVGLASQLSAAMRLIGVVAPPPPAGTTPMDEVGWTSGLAVSQSRDVVEILRKRMHGDLERAADSIGRGNVDTLEAVGDPVAELQDAAAGVDALVVGSHGRGPLSGLLFGSVSRGLAHSCPAPLFVVQSHVREVDREPGPA